MLGPDAGLSYVEPNGFLVLSRNDTVPLCAQTAAGESAQRRFDDAGHAEGGRLPELG